MVSTVEEKHCPMRAADLAGMRMALKSPIQRRMLSDVTLSEGSGAKNQQDCSRSCAQHRRKVGRLGAQ